MTLPPMAVLAVGSRSRKRARFCAGATSLAGSRKVLGWPKRCKLAHAFLWQYGYKGPKLAQLLDPLGVFLARAPLAAGGWVAERQLSKQASRGVTARVARPHRLCCGGKLPLALRPAGLTLCAPRVHRLGQRRGVFLHVACQVPAVTSNWPAIVLI